MQAMIKLKFESPNPTLEEVLSLPGMAGLDVDKDYGLICISPKDRLFVVRVKEVTELERRMRASPEIQGAYGDVRISST
jgi:hypothetical protein